MSRESLILARHAANNKIDGGVLYADATFRISRISLYYF